MPGQNFINGPPNPRGVERYTLDGKIPIDQQKAGIAKIIGLLWLIESPLAPFLWFIVAMSAIFYIEGF